MTASQLGNQRLDLIIDAGESIDLLPNSLFADGVNNSGVDGASQRL